MRGTLPAKGSSGGETFRLRREVFESLAESRGATTVNDQVRLTGVPRATLWRIRNGEAPSLASAVKIADALGVPMSALFERVRDAA